MKRKSNWLKNLLQWGTLAAIVGFVVYGLTLGEKPADVEAYCPFGGLQALGSYLVNNSLACTMSMTQIMVGVMLAVGVILFSKLFCGYLCPLGTVSEWMGRGGKKLKVSVEIRPGSIADRLLRAVKYALLFYVFYMSASSSELFCKNFDPYYAVATGFKGEITVWMTVISVALLFLGSFFVKMFWCKYICPLGALSNIFKFTLTFAGIVILLWALGLLGVASAWVWALGAACVIGYLWEMIYLKSKVFPLLRIVRDEATCTKCDVCRRKCPYSIDIKNLDKVKHIDCTLCGTCVSACPEDSLQVGGKRSLRWLPGILAVNMAAIMGDRLRGNRAAMLSAFATVLPSFLIILVIAIFLTPDLIKNNAVISSVFMGIRPAVVALIIAPVLTSAKAARIGWRTAWIPCLTALMISIDLGFASNPILYVILGAVGGYIHFRLTHRHMHKG